MPKVSVIIPCYNAGAFLERTLESVQAQLLAGWEMVVVDDGSVDDTAQIAARYAEKDLRIKVIREKNGGVCRARNAGYKEASPKSEYLVFLDQDDCLKPEMLATLADYLDRNVHVGLVHCAFDLVGPDDRPAQDARDFQRYSFDGKRLIALEPQQIETPFEAIFWNCSIIPSACMMRRSLYEATPGWDEGFGQGNEDVDLFLQFSLAAEVHFVPEKLVFYRLHSAQASRRALPQQRQQLRLFKKWLSSGGPAGARGAWLLRTWKLYEGRLVPQLWLTRAAENFRRRDVKESARCLLRSIKHLLLYLSMPLRTFFWRGV